MDNNRLTGSYYTSKMIAEYMVDWAVRTSSDVFLEPSFGDGVFIDAAITRYLALKNHAPRIIGIELQPTVFSEYMNSASTCIEGYCQDFMSFTPAENLTAIVGNPPYVSLRNLDDTSKARAIDCVAKHKIKMLTSGSLWMPFTIHAASMLVDGGRLAFVLPFELTHVKYAYPLWDFLGKHFGDIRVVRIHEDFFPDVDVETIILLAENYGGNTEVVDFAIHDYVAGLLENKKSLHSLIKISDIIHGKKPFAYSLLTSSQHELLDKVREEGITAPLIDYCKFRIGYVCADKDYFHPAKDVCIEYGLPDENLLPCISNAKEINGGTGIGVFISPGKSVSNLYLPKQLTSADKKYIKHGLDEGVNLRYKCKQRNPWYLTPSVDIPDLVLTVFGDTPKLIVNGGRYAVSNSLLAGFLSSGASGEQLICMWYNSLTLLSIELNVHSLGGGVLVLIPGETDKLETIHTVPSDKAHDIFVRLDECIKAQGIHAAYVLGDELVLKEILGFSNEQIATIRDAISALRFWRKTDMRRNKKR